MFVGQDYDLDELEKELEDLEQEELDKDLLSTGTVSQQLPDVPTDDVQEASISSGQQKKGELACKIYNIYLTI